MLSSAQGRGPMFNRHVLLLMALSGAVGLPYLSTTDVGQAWSRYRNSGAEKSADAAPAAEASTAAGAKSASSAQSAAPTTVSFEDVPTPLYEVLRFDVSSGWVVQRWPRVSASLSDTNLQGYRVPLVSGTTEGDLAGSLTYYFDKQQQVERIVFHGTTGDPRNLVSLLTSQYDFRPEKSNDPALVLYRVRKWYGSATSELSIRPARVVRAEIPHGRYEIDLAMKRP